MEWTELQTDWVLIKEKRGCNEDSQSCVPEQLEKGSHHQMWWEAFESTYWFATFMEPIDTQVYLPHNHSGFGGMSLLIHRKSPGQRNKFRWHYYSAYEPQSSPRSWQDFYILGFFFYLVGLGFELRTSYLLGRYPISWATLPAQERDLRKIIIETEWTGNVEELEGN
jgi:hypothetical protein